jgi:hypothetical protein
VICHAAKVREELKGTMGKTTGLLVIFLVNVEHEYSLIFAVKSAG